MSIQSHAASVELAMMIVRVLGGTPTEQGGLCRCPSHDDRTPSLSVRIGHSALLFHCFAGCERSRVIADIRRMGLLADIPPPARGRGPVFPSSGSVVRRHRAAAARLWASARPVKGTLASAYLHGRGVMGDWQDLRFHPGTPLGAGHAARKRPAMLAAVRDAQGLCAVQRFFLHPAGRLATDIEGARRMLGRPECGAVRLADPTRSLGLAEGVETALSAMLLLHIPVWAALSADRLGHVDIPDRVDELILLPDNDAAGRRAGAVALSSHQRAGRTVRLFWPDPSFNDWNDQLRAGGRG